MEKTLRFDRKTLKGGTALSGGHFVLGRCKVNDYADLILSPVSVPKKMVEFSAPERDMDIVGIKQIVDALFICSVVIGGTPVLKGS